MLRGRVLGGEWSCAAGLIHGVGCPKCAQYMRQTVKAWPTREERYVPQAQRGADTAPGFLEQLSEAMLQCYWRLAAD